MRFSRESHSWYWLSTCIPLFATVSFQFGRPWIYLLTLLAVILAADPMLGKDIAEIKPSDLDESWGEEIPLTFIGLWALALLVACGRSQNARPLEFVGLTVAAGVTSAFAMAHIHEVMHRQVEISKSVADAALALAGYPHYRIVHQLHHSHVGDSRYGSTARVGLSLWRHVGRSFFGASMSALESELRYVQQRRRTRLSVSLLSCGAIVALAAWRGGREGIIFYVGQSVISVFVVETIGYIQHYGLCESEVCEGQIAWDVPWWLSNRLFVNNGRHTHHHLEEARHYGQLSLIGSPLPAGYVHMFFLALVPPLWFSVMNRRLFGIPT
jgi:alkane 1-monooxygenase